MHRLLSVSSALVLLASSLAYAAQPSGLGAEAPPPTPGYSKLRMDLQVSVNGHALEPALLLDTFGSSVAMEGEPPSLLARVS